MENKNSEKENSLTEVRAILTDEPVDEVSVLLILESMIIPLLKPGAYKKTLKASSNKRAVKSGQEELKIKKSQENHTSPAQSFKESA